jgi:uncharacterized glyoxalase superfamily protein PhnB
LTESATATMSNAFPCLRYKNAPAAIAWLNKSFGCEEKLVVPNEDGTIAHAEVKLGNGIIMLASARDDIVNTKTPSEANCVTQFLYISVEDVDDLFARATAAGAETVMGLTDMDYGSRECCVRDLEGNLWCFGTYNPYTS